MLETKKMALFHHGNVPWRTTLVCERRAESGERRGNKNSKLDIPKKRHSKNRLEYTWNMLESAQNSKKWTYFRGG